MDFVKWKIKTDKELCRLRQIARAAGAWKTADGVWIRPNDMVYSIENGNVYKWKANYQGHSTIYYSTRKAALAAAKHKRLKAKEKK